MTTIMIDGKEYDIDSMSDEAKENINNIQFCDQKLAELQAETAVIQTARNAYATVLKNILEK